MVLIVSNLQLFRVSIITGCKRADVYVELRETKQAFHHAPTEAGREVLQPLLLVDEYCRALNGGGVRHNTRHVILPRSRQPTESIKLALIHNTVQAYHFCTDHVFNFPARAEFKIFQLEHSSRR